MNSKKKIKCYSCKKKINLISFSCKCNKIFCIKCKDPDDHCCKFDYKSEYKDFLKLNNPTINPEKIEVI